MYARSFNQPLNKWNVSKVRKMNSMFNGASSFNQPLNDWNVSNDVRNMYKMFWNADSFNQPLHAPNPGTAVNHADKTREAAVMYNHDEPNVGAPASVRPSPRGETYPLAGPRAVHDERRQGRRGNALRLRSRLRPLPLV